MIVTTLVLLSIAQVAASMEAANGSVATRVPSPITSGLEPPKPDAGPFAKLFIPSRESKARTALQRQLLQQGQQAEKAAPKIVCGMVVIPADPTIDPKMIIRSNRPSTTFHIKRIPPTTCIE